MNLSFLPTIFWMMLDVSSATSLHAEDALPVQLDDIYKADAAVDAVTLSDGKSAFYIRQRVDQTQRVMVSSLWQVDANGKKAAVEEGEPDASGLMMSPDGKWLLFLSTRSFADGTQAFQPVPPYSDPAADIWLMPVSGGKALPLAGKGKPYGRVITDKFYGRVAFSRDSKHLVFVADDGIDPRTEEEKKDNVIVAREDQGEGYEGYGPTQIWVADLADGAGDHAATKITRLTPGDYWYGDPQWSPDGSFIVCHANRNAEQESARYSINHNYDVWKITVADHRMTRLTQGPGPEFSPRLSPDGRRLVCLSSPRFKGPHMDVFNLMVVDLNGSEATSRVVFDHHGANADQPPHVSPSTPLPDNCWMDAKRVWFNAALGVKNITQAVDLDVGPQVIEAKPPAPTPRSKLIPAAASIGPRLRGEDEVVHWKSFDGLEIEGVLTRPPASVAKPPFKLLVMPHGGPHHRATGAGFDAQFFATRGYAVFQPNFRGSTGYGLKFLDADRFDFGGGDMKDILTGVDQLVRDGIADRERQFVYGVSYGGYMTSWLVGHTNQFRGAVAQNAVTDLNVMWNLSDLQSWTEWDMGGLPWEVPERMREHSPLTYAKQVRTPTLILHSMNDRRCPVAMGKMFYRALKECGVDTQLVLYPDEGHPIKQLPHREDVLRRVFEWFEAHDRK